MMEAKRPDRKLIAVIQSRNDGGMDQGGSGENVAIELDSIYFEGKTNKISQKIGCGVQEREILA